MGFAYIYIMTNKTFAGHDWVKIGYAKNVEKRRKQLSTTNIPYPYEIFATYEIPESEHLGDKVLHRLITNLNPKLKLTANREFFEMTPEQAYELLKSMAIIHKTEDKLVAYKDGQPINNNYNESREEVADSKTVNVNIPENGLFYCKGKTAHATGKLSGRNIIVLEGSRISEAMVLSMPERYIKMREQLIKEGVIVNNIFVVDKELNPSRASTIILGRSSNGYDDWKDHKGVKLKNFIDQNV